MNDLQGLILMRGIDGTAVPDQQGRTYLKQLDLLVCAEDKLGDFMPLGCVLSVMLDQT